jgi:ubiquinone/menaquinone biosynthesis C-methylase UbiE
MFGKDGPTLWELFRQALVSTRQGYDMLAPKFDATPFRTPDVLLEPAILAIGEVDSALDLCCGTAAAMRFLGSKCKRLVGVDFSAGMLRKAKENMAGIEAPGTQFIELDVLEMQFQDEFDVATCFGALGHILPQDQRAFLRRVRQALKPGGRFVFVTAPHSPPLSRANVLSRAFNLIMKIRNAILKPPFVMYYLTFLLPEIKPQLEQEGFSVEIRGGLFPDPFRQYCLVIATRIEA